MKKTIFAAACLAVGLVSCNPSADRLAVWKDYDVGAIEFEDKAVGTRGSEIYHEIIADPEDYIAEQARTVLSTLYDSPEDSIATVKKLRYTLEDTDGISAKGGGNGHVNIFYSTRHVEKSFGGGGDVDKVLFETRGVLLHELTHAYQLEPQGIGTYGTNRVFWAFIEGMADAVRVANGGFGPDARPKDFLRKFNRSTLEVIPWSFDGAVKRILGEEYDIDSLWREYQIAVGDIEA